jgi:hypothetical protein
VYSVFNEAREAHFTNHKNKMKNHKKLKFPDLKVGQVFSTETGSTFKVLTQINNHNTKSGLTVCLTHDHECMIGQELWFKVNQNVYLPE